MDYGTYLKLLAIVPVGGQSRLMCGIKRPRLARQKSKSLAGFTSGRAARLPIPLAGPLSPALPLLRHEEVSHVLWRRPDIFIVKVRGAASGCVTLALANLGKLMRRIAAAYVPSPPCRSNNMSPRELSYYRERAKEERARAAEAASEHAADIHLQMACI